MVVVDGDSVVVVVAAAAAVVVVVGVIRPSFHLPHHCIPDTFYCVCWLRLINHPLLVVPLHSIWLLASIGELRPNSWPHRHLRVIET